MDGERHHADDQANPGIRIFLNQLEEHGHLNRSASRYPKRACIKEYKEMPEKKSQQKK